MAYPAQTLVSDAFTLAQINARNLQILSGPQGEEGLQWLNEIIRLKSIESRQIPYYQEYDFTAIAGQEKYFIPNLVEVETYTFNIGPVRFSGQQLMRDAYQGAPRVDNITSLPFTWNIERSFENGIDGATMSIFFLPEQAYPIKIWGKFGLATIPTLSYDMFLTYPQYYITYLKYALAVWICGNYARPVPPTCQEIYDLIQKDIIEIGPADLTMMKMNAFGGGTNYVFFDKFAGGWRPAGAI